MPLVPKLEFDTREFTRALGLYAEATKKDEAVILNRAARNLAYRSAQNTPKVAASRIRASLMADPHLRYALTSLALRKRGIGRLPAPEFAKEVERFVSRRASSAAYLRQGWGPVIVALGGTFRGTKFKGASGTAKKATVARAVAEIINIVSQPDEAHARGAERIGGKAMQSALDFVAKDMIDFADSLMAKTAKGFSAA